MPLPFENQALRAGMKTQLEQWVNSHGIVQILSILQTIQTEKATYVVVFPLQSTAAGAASAGWSSGATNCATYIAQVGTGPTSF